MTTKDKFFTLKEAQKITNKSVRTLRRYLDKLDKVDTETLTTLTKKDGKKILVSQKFIDFVKLGGKNLSKLSQSDANNKTDFSETSGQKENKTDFADSVLLKTLQENLKTKQADIERLQKRNDELYKSITDKDEQLKTKDQDFKMLTSKVISLQDEIKSIEAPKEKEVQDQAQPDKTKKKADKIDYAIVGIMAVVGLALIVMIVLEYNK